MARRRTEIVRVYDDPGRQGDHPVLIDRLWPRGRTKESVDYDEWLKDVAPSGALRRWYGHDPGRFTEFALRYREELASPPAQEAVARLRRHAARGRVTLLTATRDVEHSGAAVLREVLEDHGR